MENCFKNDFVTRAFLREHGDEIKDPKSMEVGELANAITYCKDSVKNPYTRELVERAGLLDEFDGSYKIRKKHDIFVAAAAGFGIKFY